MMLLFLAHVKPRPTTFACMATKRTFGKTKLPATKRKKVVAEIRKAEQDITEEATKILWNSLQFECIPRRKRFYELFTDSTTQTSPRIKESLVKSIKTIQCIFKTLLQKVLYW